MLLPCTELHIYSYCLLIIYTVHIDLLVNARSLVTWILPSSGCFNAAAVWGVPFHLEPWDFSRTRCIWNAKIIQYLGKQKTCHFIHIQFVVWQQVWVLGGNSDKFYFAHFSSKKKKMHGAFVIDIRHYWIYYWQERISSLTKKQWKQFYKPGNWKSFPRISFGSLHFKPCYWAYMLLVLDSTWHDRIMIKLWLCPFLLLCWVDWHSGQQEHYWKPFQHPCS